jgi:hypothetical protein
LLRGRESGGRRLNGLWVARLEGEREVDMGTQG